MFQLYILIINRNQIIFEGGAKMLNEKKIMADKLFSFTIMTIAAGFFSGLGVTLAIASVDPNEINTRLLWAGIIFIGIGMAAAIWGNSLYSQVRRYILRPYFEEENDDKQTEQSDALLDSSAD
jgi:hypothetical protein